MDALNYSFQMPEWKTRAKEGWGYVVRLYDAVQDYIVPKYYHDRSNRSVQMRLYTLTKRHFVLVFVAFFTAFTASVVLGIAGPNIDVYAEYRRQENLPGGPFKLESPHLSRFNRSLWLTSVIEVDNGKGESFQKTFNVSIEIRGLKEDDSVKPISNIFFNHTRTLSCEKGELCEELLLLHVSPVKYYSYVITVYFQGLENAKVTEVSFKFRTYNPSFCEMEIWFRFVFLVLSFIITCMFAHSLRKFSMRDWSIEQKWLSVLLPFLLLYNDPIFPLNFLVDSWVTIILDNIFQTTFLCALLLFWLCAYHGIRKSDRKWLYFYLPKLILVGVIWVAAVVLACWSQYRTLYDPTFNYKVDGGNFLGLVIFFLCVGSLYLLYLVFLIIRAFTELKSLPYMNLRLRFMTVLMLFVVAVCVAVVIMRFGIGILQNNFISELSTYYKNSAEFLAFYSLLNFYLYTMAFVYSPSKNAHKDSYFKDNPTFSMLNESEDELIYGSDSDDNAVTRPLQNGTSYQESEDE
ncbi:transmembrane protein 181-like isoform X2 [Acanthaster planci]|uniref:Transmembrane protein 181-like isoform X2 n=1 Tax=Acanthaster planci TaxID=133434 RepID=A0A8B7ZMJ0_ACAPL|nr:transmembrane protein 181-like isoform X2 [Acanthaster planci]